MLTVTSGFKSAIKSVAPYSNAKVDYIKYTDYFLANSVVNGNFNVDLASWNLGVGCVWESGRMKAFGTVSTYRIQPMAFVIGHKYYVSFDTQVDRFVAGIFALQFRNGGTLVYNTQTSSTAIGTYKTTAIVDVASACDNIYLGNLSSANADAYYDNIIVTDLTAIYGTGNEPTISEMNAKFGETTVNFTSDDIKSLEINGSAIINDKVLGNIAQHSLTLELLGDKTSDIVLSDTSRLEPYVGVKVGASYEYAKQQNFIVTEVSYSDTTNITKVIATDYLVKLNNDTWVDENTYPMTLKAYLESVLLHCGLTLENTTFLNSAFSVATQPIADYTSCKDIIRQVAEMALSFVVINKVSNKFELRTAFELPSTVDDALTKDNYSSLKLNDHNFGTLGVNTLVLKISQVDGENTTVENATNVAIDGAVEIVIEDNSFINTQALRESVDNDMFAIIDEYMFQPFALEYRGFAYLELGDIIEITKMDNSTIKLPIFETYIKYNGGVNGRLVAKTLSKSQTSYKYISSTKQAIRNAEIQVDKANASILLKADQTSLNTTNSNVTTAQNTANSKAKTFLTTPTTPYYIGDSWIDTNATTGENKVCTTQRLTGAFVAGDWTKDGVTSRVDSAEFKITPTAITSTVTSSTTYINDLSAKEPTIYKQASVPSAPSTGTMWLETDVTPNVWYRWSGSAWVKATPTQASEVDAYSKGEIDTTLTSYSTITQTSDSIALAIGTNTNNFIPYAQADFEQGTINDSGVSQASTAALRMKNYVYIELGKTYTLSISSGLHPTLCRIYFYTSANAFISYSTFSLTPTSVTAPFNAKYFRVRIYNSALSAFALSNLDNHSAGVTIDGLFSSGSRYVFDKNYASFYSDGLKLYDNSATPVLKVYFDTVNSRYVFNGEISADVGVIGGFTIGATKLTAGATNATAVGVASGETYAFWAGHLTASSAPFRVTRAGALTITSGAIAGWTIAASSISKGGIKLDSANERIYFNTDAYLEAYGSGTSVIQSSGSVFPSATNSYNLGGSGNRWASIYVSAIYTTFSGTNYTITRDVNGFLKAV
jgi:hypothetical protein